MPPRQHVAGASTSIRRTWIQTDLLEFIASGLNEKLLLMYALCDWRCRHYKADCILICSICNIEQHHILCTPDACFVVQCAPTEELLMPIKNDKADVNAQVAASPACKLSLTGYRYAEVTLAWGQQQHPSVLLHVA